MARIGVFGGSFDPVHLAHERLVETAQAQLALDELLLVPAFRSPHKSQAHASSGDRLRMLEMVFEGRERTRIDGRELRRATATPTVRSLEELAVEKPGDLLVLLLGQDSFERLQTWVRPERLAQLCEIAVMPRPGGGDARPLRWRNASVQWLDGPALDLSSTAIRAALARGERPEGLRDEVFAYIHERSLYGCRGPA